eukprot:4188658-Alexandrium_andersonii.AAC.1
MRGTLSPPGNGGATYVRAPCPRLERPGRGGGPGRACESAALLGELVQVFLGIGAVRVWVSTRQSGASAAQE